MPAIPFPNVPKVAGVPNIARKPSAATVARGGLGILQGAVWQALKKKYQWGMYTKKNKAFGETPASLGLPIPVPVPSFFASQLTNAQVSVVDLNVMATTMVSDFPIERGSFASYNKVIRPTMIALTYAVTGDVKKNRAVFFDMLEKARVGNELFDVYMPEKKFVDFSVTNFNIRRTSESGSDILFVEVVLSEIRQITVDYSASRKKATETNTNKSSEADGAKASPPKNASSEAKKDVGSTQPKPPDKGFFETIKAKAGDIMNKAVDYANNLRDKVIDGNKKYHVPSAN